MNDLARDITFDAHTALIVVDVQNDFTDPRGGLYVQGGEQVVPTINQLIDDAKRAGALVVYTQDWHPETTPHFERYGGTWPVHCVAGSWGAELYPELVVDGPVVRKGTGNEDGYSGFTARDVHTGEDKPTDLKALLDEHGANKVVVVGLAQDVCVKETVLDARRLGYQTRVVLEATRPVNAEAGDDQRANEAMAGAGAAVA